MSHVNSLTVPSDVPSDGSGGGASGDSTGGPSTGHAALPPGGARRATTVDELSHVGLRLFVERGFEQTTVDDIVREVGIGRRTFFRYFSSKNDLPWGAFDALVEGMRQHLSTVPDNVPLAEALNATVIDFNSYPEAELGSHRQRMRLLMTVPSLVAHSVLRYESWRQAISEFAGRRLGEPAGELRPRLVGWLYLAASFTAYEQWLSEPNRDLVGTLRSALSLLPKQLRDMDADAPTVGAEVAADLAGGAAPKGASSLAGVSRTTGSPGTAGSSASEGASLWRA